MQSWFRGLEKALLENYLPTALNNRWMFCFEKPLKACDEAIRLDPNYAAAWNNKGAALCGLKRYDEALKACDEAIRHDPNQPSAWSNKGLALNGLERYDEALKACREAIKLIIFKHFLSILCD